MTLTCDPLADDGAARHRREVRFARRHLPAVMADHARREARKAEAAAALTHYRTTVAAMAARTDETAGNRSPFFAEALGELRPIRRGLPGGADDIPMGGPPTYGDELADAVDSPDGYDDRRRQNIADAVTAAALGAYLSKPVSPDDEPPAVIAHPAAERPEAKFVTVYAVALIFQPRDSDAADPLVTLRQLVRQGRRPLTDKEAGTVAAAAEVENWKVTRPPLEAFGPPTAVVCWQAIPAFS